MAPMERVSAVNAELKDAIEHASLARLQRTLLAISERVPDANRLVQTLLLVQNPLPAAGTKRRAEAETADAPPVIRQRRYEHCVQCKQEYETMRNDDRACCWHGGSLEPDEYADHEEDCHGPFEDLVDDCPDLFLWSCCNGRGDAGGCKRGRHSNKKPPSGKYVSYT